METVYWFGLGAILIHNLTLAFLSLFANIIKNYNGSEHIPLYLRVPGIINSFSSIAYFVVTPYLFFSFKSIYFTIGTILSILAFLTMAVLRKKRQATVANTEVNITSYQFTKSDLTMFNLKSVQTLFILSLPYILKFLFG